MTVAKLKDLGFETNFSVDFAPEFPGSGYESFYFTKGSGHKDCVTVEVTPLTGAKWIGRFEKGDEGTTGAFSCPEKDRVCIVANGQGFIVSVLDPRDYRIVESYPIRSVHGVPALNLILFLDYSRVVAYGLQGLAWSSAQVSWDGLDIQHIGNDTVDGVGWDAPSGSKVTFSVNLRTGYHTGGSAPPSLE